MLNLQDFALSMHPGTTNITIQSYSLEQIGQVIILVIQNK